MHTDDKSSLYARLRERLKRLQAKGRDTFDANLRLIQAVGFGWTIFAIAQFVIQNWPWNVWYWPLAAWRWLWA